MRTNPNASRGFTLIELLSVIAIIAILAALLLPALAQGKARAKRIQCVSQLHQAGIGFHGFAHDHQGKFPMQASSDGSAPLDYAVATNADYSLGLALRYWRDLEGELNNPRILVCPSDNRTQAVTFALMK